MASELLRFENETVLFFTVEFVSDDPFMSDRTAVLFRIVLFWTMLRFAREEVRFESLNVELYAMLLLIVERRTEEFVSEELNTIDPLMEALDTEAFETVLLRTEDLLIRP